MLYDALNPSLKSFDVVENMPVIGFLVYLSDLKYVMSLSTLSRCYFLNVLGSLQSLIASFENVLFM